LPRLPLICFFPCAAVLLFAAADPVWRSNVPIAKWTEAEAREVLQNSPWAKMVLAGVMRRESEDERRAGGNMGQPTGVGYDHIGEKRTRPNTGDLFGRGASPSVVTLPTIKLMIRWESAMPVRAAELKVKEEPPPTSSEDCYSIAVFGVPGEYFKGDPEHLGEPLKSLAVLKRAGQKDVKPFNVEVFMPPSGVVVLYSFPLSAEITKKDGTVEFNAVIGRLQVVQSFSLEEMVFQSKLAL